MPESQGIPCSKQTRRWKWLQQDSNSQTHNHLGRKRTLSNLAKLAKLTSMAKFVLWTFFLLRLLCISINLPHKHAICYLELLVKLQKQICRTVGPSLATFLEPLAHRRDVARLSFIGITFVDVHLNWLNWFHFLILERGLHVILIDCVIFLSQFLDVTKMTMSTVSSFAQLHSGIVCL